jgi:hypothetical protein
VPQQGVIETVVSVAEVVCGLFAVDGVPEHDGCAEEIEFPDAVALLFKPAVPNLTEPVEERGPGECVACLAQARNAFTLFW